MPARFKMLKSKFDSRGHCCSCPPYWILRKAPHKRVISLSIKLNLVNGDFWDARSAENTFVSTKGGAIVAIRHLDFHIKTFIKRVVHFPIKQILVPGGFLEMTNRLTKLLSRFDNRGRCCSYPGFLSRMSLLRNLVLKTSKGFSFFKL